MITSAAYELLHATQCFQLGVPIIHIAAVLATWPSKSLSDSDKAKVTHAVTFPIAGGPRTFIFQVLSWVLFAISILLAIPPWYVPDTPHLDIFMALAAFSAVMSLLFMLKSILLFDPTDNALRQGHLWRKIARSRATIQWDVSRLPSKYAAFKIILALGMLWSVLGASLLVAAAQFHAGNTLRIVYFAFAAACFTIAAFTTHGLGGHLRHRHKKEPSHSVHSLSDSQPTSTSAAAPPSTLRRTSPPHHTRSKSTSASLRQWHMSHSGSLHRHARSELPPTIHENWLEDEQALDRDDAAAAAAAAGATGLAHFVPWRFYQPFRGGSVFVATQAAGWLLYSVALTFLLWTIGATALGIAHSLKTWAVAAGFTGVAAQIAIGMSLLYYNAKESVVVIPISDLLPKLTQLQQAASFAPIVIVLYLQVHAVVATVVISFTLLPFLHAFTLWAGGLTVYFASTGFGAERSGSREWPRFRNWIGREAQRVLPYLLGSFEVVADSDATFDPKKRYVFGYAPHGLFPIGAAYLPCTPAFKKVVGQSVDPATLSASVVFQLPFLRDLLLWAGTRVVNRATFVRTLRERGAVLLVPGGQAELVEAYRAARKQNPAFALCTRHKGFVRLALQEGAALVPVVVLGEVTSLRNAIVLPRLQRLTYKLLGFPVPFLMAGRGGMLPLPSKTGLRFVVGRPIEVESALKEERSQREGPLEEVDEATVDAFHRKFYEEVERLYEQHKNDFPGYENMPLVHA